MSRGAVALCQQNARYGSSPSFPATCLDFHSTLSLNLGVNFLIIRAESPKQPCTDTVERICCEFFGSRRVSWQTGKKPDWWPRLRAILFSISCKSRKFATCAHGEYGPR